MLLKNAIILSEGITSSSAADGLSVSASKVRLGHAAAGSGLSDFTANRFLYMVGFALQIGGTAGNDLFKFSGAGLATFTNDGLGASQVDTRGHLLLNNTAAAAGAQQYSPATIWAGKGWKTTATAASQDVRFRAYAVPVEGTANPTATWTLESSINGGAYANPLTYNSAGNLAIAGKFTIGNDPLYTTQGTSAVLNQTTNGGIALVPNGTGALTGAIPDGTTAGGNARGQYATDWQRGTRFNSSMVASGNYSTIGGGYRNLASGLYSTVPGGSNNNVSGDSSFATGDSNTVSSFAAFAAGAANTVSGSYSAAVGRSNTISSQQSFCFGTFNTISNTYSFANGAGAKVSTIAQNVFGRGIEANGSTPGNGLGRSQIVNGITGFDTKIPSFTAPKASGATQLFNPTNVCTGTEIPFWIPATSDQLFVVEADIQIRVVGINGTATGVTVGDIKQVKIRQTGKVIAGTLTFLSALVTTLDYEDASLNTMTFVFKNSTNRVNIQCTNATFAGGGTLELLAMATYKVSESSAS